MFFDLFFFLFRNGFTQFVGLGGCVPGEFHGGAHQLFLIDGDSERVLEDRLHGGVTIDHFRFAVHARDVIRDERHRTRTIQRDHRDDVIEVFLLHLDEPARHAAALHLENSSRLPGTHDLKCFWVVDGNVIQVQFDAVTFFDQVACARHNR